MSFVQDYLWHGTSSQALCSMCVCYFMQQDTNTISVQMPMCTHCCGGHALCQLVRGSHVHEAPDARLGHPQHLIACVLITGAQAAAQLGSIAPVAVVGDAQDLRLMDGGGKRKGGWP